MRAFSKPPKVADQKDPAVPLRIIEAFHNFFGRFSHFLLVGFFAFTAFIFFLLLFSTPTTRVLVSTEDLAAGQLITEKDLTVTLWEGNVPPDAVNEITSAVNKRLLVDLPANTPLREAYFQSGDPTAEANRSRLTLPITAPVAQLLTTGDHIDIYLPKLCADEMQTCAPQRIAHDVIVIQVLKNGDHNYSNTEAALILDVIKTDIPHLIGVADTSLLKYILI
ncbi:SAF domain-containing protein [Gleimia sp. 6138-11-ORH1]|uniref:SAF domain-containing protein n=1 Tax=Gleimia sp. 6138-11-ORH1 TaxID=2973937 RepID=UPI002168D7C0|nr:SAF domain-containing protein [Gleimia sp. 6138-11-ORH1]MCS4484965.1 SAF domain-containing protein [Gleimia sp. 6138-11-ORH1]